MAVQERRKYISHQIQNEILQIMALQVLREISGSLHSAQFYSIMVDECCDVCLAKTQACSFIVLL